MVRDSEFCWELEVPMSPMFVYLVGKFLDGRKPSSSTTKEHLFCVVCIDIYVMVLMVLLALLFPPRKLAIQDLPGHNAH